MRKRKILAVFLIVFTVMLSSFAFYGYQILYTPNVLLEAPQEEVLFIERGTSFKELQDQLDSQGFVNDLVSFSFLAKIIGYHKEIKPGHYTLQPDMANLEVIKILRRGNPPVKVQINEVRTLRELSGLLGYYFLTDSAAWNQFFSNEDAYLSMGFDQANIISIFVPDTYEFYYETAPSELLEKMKGHYERFWTESRKQKAANLDLTPLEVTTLASIVKGETSKLEEAPTVAGLYLNRLGIGMPLQADPTLVFANDIFGVRRIRHGDKEIDSPYNTYKYKGLPPGPINIPGTRYIDAVLEAEDHKYLYMCAKADFSGYHAFAKNFSEHLVNARKFQRALNERGIER